MESNIRMPNNEIKKHVLCTNSIKKLQMISRQVIKETTDIKVV